MKAMNWIPKVFCICFLVLSLLPALTVAAAAGRGPEASSEAAFCVPPGRRQLFLDDYGIAEVENLKRTMHTPAKKGAVIRSDYTTGVRVYGARSAPMWDRDAKLFRFWINGRPDDMAIGACSYFESKDGLHWTKPNLGQVEHRGSRENNYVSVVVDGKTIGFECAAYDPTDPDPTRRFKGIGRRPSTIGFLYQLASDGVTWRSVGKRFPIRKGDDDNFSFDPVEPLFIATLRHNGGPYGRAVDLATSKDFKHWTRHGLIFHADKLDQELNRKAITAQMADVVADPRLAETDFYEDGNYKVDVYNMPVFRYESHYLAMPAMHPSRTMVLSDRSDNISFKVTQLMCSRDLRNWTRLGDRRNFIGLSPPGGGAYDIAQAFPPSNAVVRGDELWFYYTGTSDVGWPPKKQFQPPMRKWTYSRPDKSAICLAVLRRDGFISLDAGNKGTVLTQPFTLPGGELFVNVDAPMGELRVEVLDGGGKVLAVSKPMKGDLLRGEVKWQGGNIVGLKGKAVSLRFTLRNASLYSYWLE